LGRIPPQNIDIEEYVLGSIIVNYHYIAKYPYLKPEVFYRDAHVKIYKALLDLYNNDQKPDIAILTDYLMINHEIESVGGIVYITKLTGKSITYIDTHVKVLMDRYFCRKIIEVTQIAQNKAFDLTYDPVEIMDELHNNLAFLSEFDGEVTNNFSRTLENTLGNIKSASEGENVTVLKSGFKYLDKRFTFRTRFVCIVAGPEGSGKTKFVTSIIRGMLDNEPDLAVQWFSFEDDSEQIIRSFLAMDVKKTTKELQSIGYKMSDKDIKEIETISKKYEKYNIEFYNRATSINNIVSRSKRFKDRNKEKKKVIVIDNLGLIDCDKIGVDRDDHIAAKIKSIADNNNSAVILVHHFTKEISRKANIEDGYRPRKEYLKGSTRILDYVQQALFVNLLRKYPDLLSEEKHFQLNFLGAADIEFTEENFDKHLWSINSQPDKDTKSINDLRTETLFKLRSLINNNTKFSNGKVITFPDIVQKYAEYNTFIDTRNKGREEKYKSQKDSILTFIVRKQYNSNYVTSSVSPRSQYLYGNNPNLRYHIDDLFIVESIKNRDDDNLTENALFRFVADLGYNIFTEVEETIHKQLK